MRHHNGFDADDDEPTSFFECPGYFIWALVIGCLPGIGAIALLALVAWMLHALFRIEDRHWLLAAGALYAAYVERYCIVPILFEKYIQAGAIFSVCAWSFTFGPAFGLEMIMAAAAGSAIGIVSVWKRQREAISYLNHPPRIL